jgi:hypothetical protein
MYAAPSDRPVAPQALVRQDRNHGAKSELPQPETAAQVSGTRASQKNRAEFLALRLTENRKESDHDD